MKILVEIAQLQDLNALVKLENEVFNSSDGLLTRRAFRYHMKSNNLLLVARQSGDNSMLVGYILVLKRKLSARIYSLATNTVFQGQGVAKTLVKKALAECAASHLYKVKLEARATNFKAINLYKALGFEEQYIYPNYYEDNEDANCMEWRHALVNKVLQPTRLVLTDQKG